MGLSEMGAGVGVVRLEEGRYAMNDVIRRISERLARPSSRRGLLSGIGKFALGTAAAVAAQSLFGHVAEAIALMRCCDGAACADSVCPAGTSLMYTWSCGGSYFCHDCFSTTEKNAKGKPKYICTYSATRSVPQRPPVRHHRKVVHHAAPRPADGGLRNAPGGGRVELM